MKKKEAVTEKVNEYEILISDQKKLQEKVALLKQNIQESGKETVVCFIDMVDSTKFKSENISEPEIWILRLKQFSDIVENFVQRNRGRVVKYIGDEVLAVFDSETMYEDSQSFLLQQQNIEKLLYSVTGVPTLTKISIDTGKVYFLTFKEHPIPDPQGLPVDKCARIAKYVTPSKILSSFNYVSRVPNSITWTEIGKLDLKGIGETSIYQMGPPSIKLETKIEITDSHYKELQKRLSECQTKSERLILQNRQIIEKNKSLAADLEKKEIKVDDKNIVKIEEKKDRRQLWQIVETELKELTKFIRDSPGSIDYAKFLFLHMKGVGEKYNVYEGKKFDSCIKANLVYEEFEGYYKLDPDHPRNEKSLKIIFNIEKLINEFLSKHKRSEEDLFEYSFNDSEFWKKYIHFDVGE